ncbi:glycosyltransferase family 2 protein [Limimaricola pyoseonensis]|uniref:Dolichol-phosphate mannosyltransferase n=1 Tax=Limimaricola pyoseonensis TaxID=521013 RepID=A0A1G7A8M0_9RHOB|nr:glycosyltransferase family 2 protein [Limimaricola pyoseonensis]SDE11162.1 dolichol-phosphate mannosyltransferase [Limimaricola pyoseonensis]
MISLVIPAYNEAGNIEALVREAFELLPADLLGEVIVVDDCSTDDGVARLVALRETHPRLRVLRHARNAGQSASVRTGVAAARYPLVATLDGDGQNPPGDIPALVAAYDPDGPQLVGGVREKRRDTRSKRIASRLANGLRRRVLNDDCPDTGCGLKVFERDRHLALPFFHGQHRYLPALFRAYGARTAYIAVGDRARQHGASHYTNWKRGLQGVPDLIGVRWLVMRARPARAEEVA